MQLDEELGIVQFPHHTVRVFLLSTTLDPKLSGFHFQLKDINHYIGEICVTYLNFNDFKTALIQRSKPMTQRTPSAIAETALGYGSKAWMAVSLLNLFKLGRSRESQKIDIVSSLARYEGIYSKGSKEKLAKVHSLLAYACDYWLQHTTDFEEGESRTWT
jgi:hypothetical protein